MPLRKSTGAPEGIRLTAEERRGLYAARRFMAGRLQQKLGLRVPFDVYFQDPFVAANDPALAFDENCYIPWEPKLWDDRNKGS